ncbi:MAG: hypothetical protein JWO31_2102 [Phycisphaerales bacterium]|nr:hypothetical protein [Phycisphaerales bacterium]
MGKAGGRPINLNDSDLPDDPATSPHPVRPSSPLRMMPYAGPATGPSSARRHPAVACAQFIAGMVAPAGMGWAMFSIGGGGSGILLFIMLALAIPVVLLAIPPARLVGAGWLTALAVGSLTLCVICGR